MVTRHERRLMCTKYTPSHYSTYLIFVVSYTNFVNCIKFSTVCCTSCRSFTGTLYLLKRLWTSNSKKMVKFYVHVSPVFSCWVTNLIYLSCIHVSTLWILFVAFATLISSYYITNKAITTDTPKSHEVCDNFAYYAGNMLNAFAILLCSKLFWHNKLKPTAIARSHGYGVYV